MAPKKKLINISDSELGAIYDAGKTATISFIKTLIDKINELAELKEIVDKQQEEINRLKSTISKDSHNSNKPPSSDNPYKRSKTKSLRKKGGKPGGQEGHKGSYLKQVNKPDDIIQHTIQNKICECGCSLESGKLLGYDKRQEFDIPKVAVKVTEHRAEIKECPICSKIHMADFPSDIIQKAQYGSNIKTLAAWLKHYGLISYERIAELLSDLLGIGISVGTLVNITNACASELKTVYDQIKIKITESELVHFDETGLRVCGNLNWLHVAGNCDLTYYYVHQKRGTEAMDAMGILPHFNGIAIHDHWKAYYQYNNPLHGLCNTHHLRELIFFEEDRQTWAGKIKQCLLDAKDEKAETGLLTEARIIYYKSRLKRLIREGLKLNPENIRKNGKRGRPKQSPEYNLLKRLRDYLDDVLRFITNPEVPFDNNSGERDIRMMKVQQKISGAFRSEMGATNFCIIRSYISSIKKCSQSVFDSIQSIFKGNVILPYALIRAE